MCQQGCRVQTRIRISFPSLVGSAELINPVKLYDFNSWPISAHQVYLRSLEHEAFGPCWEPLLGPCVPDVPGTRRQRARTRMPSSRTPQWLQPWGRTKTREQKLRSTLSTSGLNYEHMRVDHSSHVCSYLAALTWYPGNHFAAIREKCHPRPNRQRDGSCFRKTGALSWEPGF